MITLYIENTVHTFLYRRTTPARHKLQILGTYRINHLKLKLAQIIFNNSVRTAKKTPHFTITKINWLTLFKEIIPVYTENYTKHINTFCGQNTESLVIKAGGTYKYHSALES
jgi:hypothetical protein